jgi:deazaflavin-dependent oxidoreductase (nitroreductase family)
MSPARRPSRRYAFDFARFFRERRFASVLRFLPEHGMADDEFAKVLNRRRQISITVTGRRSGRAITIPVWFVHGEGALWLLPVSGSDTQWYRNLEKDRAITIQAGEIRKNFHARLLQDAEAVSSVVRQFREKYTAEDIKRWYSRLDVAVKIPLKPPTAKL